MSKRKIPRAAAKLLPFKGLVIWPLPGEIKPLEFMHPPINARGDRRKSAEPAQVNPATPQTESRDLAEAEET